jgi:peptidoglycan-associated lipoprotein
VDRSHYALIESYIESYEEGDSMTSRLKFLHLKAAVVVMLALLSAAGCSRRLPAVPGPSADVGSDSKTSPGAAGPGADALPGGANLPGSVEERERRVYEERRLRELAQQQSAQTASGLTREQFLSEDVRFDYNSFTLSGEGKQVLEQKMLWLVGHPNVAVQIEGHCDERGTVAYNLALGERRANAVKQYLVALGVEPKRLTTISYGEEFALDPGHSEEAWRRNRRAHFAILNP